jgi:hypothetical protein
MNSAQYEAEEAFTVDRAAQNVQLPYPLEAALSRAQVASDNQPWPTDDGPAEPWSEDEIAEWADDFCAAYAARAAQFCNEHDA